MTDEGPGLINTIELATAMIVPYKEFDAKWCYHSGCPSDRSDLHGLLCRKILKDLYLPAILRRASAQI
ncbi:hypothetical protein TALK_01285 [Thalassospira alkalitolerans]|uniref:Uncharacterized protein n=1 Tax=Thalassospira alkalitolerans TaxID=1293890 RepID=A0A1Y2LFP4_9PROT|nr:hypothetical protein TALK_01285 [Thalassospira alkalitolerans]